MRKKEQQFQGEYKIGIISSLSATIIWFVLVSLWPLIVANIISLWKSEIVLLWQYFVAGISIGVALLGSVVFYKNNINKFKPKFPSLSMDYMYERIESELFFKNREDISYFSRYDILALKEITEMKRSHDWSGDYISEPIIESPCNHEIEKCKDVNSIKTTIIKFEVPLQKNERTSFKLKYELGDSLRKMNTYIGHLVKNPTEKVILRLCVPPNLVKSVKKCVYADAFAQINLSQPQIITPKAIGDIIVYEWEIESPSLLYYYRISWDFL